MGLSIEMELKQLILERYNSVREFSKRINMPYSTLDSIFKRGVANASVSNIIRICDTLMISADALAAGRIELRVADGYSADEKEIIRHYRSMNDHGRLFLLESARTCAGNPAMQKENREASAM